MATVRTYTTGVLSDDGALQTEVMSVPRYFADAMPRDPFGLLEVELGVRRAAPVSQDSLASLLGQIAYETTAARRAGAHAVSQIVDAVVNEPVVVIERSPAVGSSLYGLLSQGGVGYILVGENKPFLAIAAEAGIVIVWFISGPTQGVREGL